MTLRNRKPWAMAAVGATAVAVLGTTVAPAQAVDNWSCNTTSYVLGNDATTGTLWRYPLSKAGTTTAAFGTRVQIGAGWAGYWIHAGGGGYIWGWKADGTLYAWRHDPVANTFPMAGTPLNGPDGKPVDFGTTTDAYDRMHAVDANNNIFVIDANGVILRYQYDFATKKWPVWREVVDTGFLTTTYDQLWTSDGAAMYARTKAGDLYRFRYDDNSHRLVGARIKVGTGWQGFKKNFSIGGDVNFGVRSTDGALVQYRYNDTAVSPEPGFPVSGDIVGTNGWASLRTATGFADSCRRTVPVVTAPTVPIEQNVPVATMSQGNSLYLSYTDNIGRLWWGFVRDTSDMGNRQWTAIHEANAFSGQPTLASRSAGKAGVYAHTINGTVLGKDESTAGSGSTGAFTEQGGAMLGSPTSIKLSTGESALAATDEQGAVWVRMQYNVSGYGEYRAWEKVAPVTAYPGSQVTLADAGGGTMRMYVRTVAGHVSTATYSNTRVKGTWQDLGVPGAGARGRISVLTYPGMAQRIVVTDSSGFVHTKRQSSTLAWDAEWTVVDGVNAVEGSASAILAPDSGLVEIMARNSAGRIVLANESAQGSGTFREFYDALPEDPNTFVADPTVFVYSTTGGQAWGVTSYARPGEVQIYRVVPTAPGARTVGTRTFTRTPMKVHGGN